MKKWIFISQFMCIVAAQAQLKVLSSGNVGINSTTPLSSFQIYDDYTKVALGSANSITNGISYLGFNAVRQSNGTWLSANNGTKNGASIIYGDLDGSINFATIASTGNSNQTYSNSTVTANTMVKFGTYCYIATGTNNPPGGIRNFFKGWKTAFDNGTQTTLYFDLSNIDPRIWSTRNSASGDPQIVFYNSNTGNYVDIKARSYLLGSDASLKQNIEAITSATEKIIQLQPVSFNWNGEQAHHAKSYGFIAQQVEQVLPDIVFTDDTSHLKSINYIAIIPYLVQAFKEQQHHIDLLNAKITNDNKSTQITTNSPSSSENENNAYLIQNTPNPFNTKTIIRYYVPEPATSASLMIFNMQGTLIKTYQINTKKDGYTEINGGEMQPGMYLYSLIIDGIEIDTKRMILTD
ncbi:MAG: T9SS type A sorting domain-containing protein [Bacteroidales bacterium]|jgi:hypothetical protein|nr:T9SS type A sorting domain-containing protein [Bacteroidales bacterium]